MSSPHLEAIDLARHYWRCVETPGSCTLCARAELYPDEVREQLVGEVERAAGPAIAERLRRHLTR